MRLDDAVFQAERLNRLPNVRAVIVRILPRSVDPPQNEDHGWDVEVHHDVEEDE